MANAIKQLLGTSDLLLGGGEIFYMVDSDFRTAAQGWSQADGTGPLDLFGTRNPGRVFRTEDGVTEDDSQLQAAIDAMVDFRGDTLFFTPGSYTSATALTCDVPGARYLGPPSGNAMRAAASLTGVAALMTVSVDDNEFANLRFVPVTATTVFSVASGADSGYIHKCFWDSEGVSASVETKFVVTTTNTDWLYEGNVYFVDGAQGEAYNPTAALRHRWIDELFIVNGATWATSVLFETTASAGCLFQRCLWIGEGGSSLLTNPITGMAGANMAHFIDCRFSGTLTPTLGNFETGFDATTGAETAETYQTGDATTEAGVVMDWT